MEKDEILKGSAKANKAFLETVPLAHLFEIDRELMTEDEQMARAADADIFYDQHFSKVLDLFLLEELRYLGNEAQNDYMLLFCRGHIAMIDKLKNWFVQNKSLNLSRFTKEEEREGML